MEYFFGYSDPEKSFLENILAIFGVILRIFRLKKTTHYGTQGLNAPALENLLPSHRLTLLVFLEYQPQQSGKAKSSSRNPAMCPHVFGVNP